MTKIVQAWLHADDFLFDAWFDITDWLEQATDEEIVELDQHDWTGDPATKVSDFYQDKLRRVESVYGYTRHNADVRDVTKIDPNAGKWWVQEYRPHLLNQLKH